jgi:fermentation-respiration switch protein FrsA (DUF1100 family)
VIFTLSDLWLALQTIGGIAGVFVFLRWYEPRMIYYPHYPTRRLERTPAVRGWRYEELTLTAEDRTQLSAWFLPAEGAEFTVLLLHGNAGNISHRLEKAHVLLDLGVSVLLLDYRGYGESEGKPNESGTYQDARAAYQYLTETRGILPEQVIVFGESLGTGVAVELATVEKVGGLILEAGFTSLADVGQRIFWFLPGVRWLVKNRYDSRRKIGRLAAPLLLLHSREDEVFSFRHAERLYAAAPEPKRLVPLRGRHADGFFTSEAECRDALREFLMDLRHRASNESVA